MEWEFEAFRALVAILSTKGPHRPQDTLETEVALARVGRNFGGFCRCMSHAEASQSPTSDPQCNGFAMF